MQQDVFIVLGSPNSPTGILSDISKSRLDYCVNQFKKDNLVLCTGGWGPHFNTSEHPHATFAKKYLIENGISENHFLDFALSSNTVDDAVKIKPILSKIKYPNLTVIASDYHLDRVKLIFEEILEAFKISYVGVKSNLDKDDFDKLLEHEQKAIQAIVKNGLYY